MTLGFQRWLRRIVSGVVVLCVVVVAAGVGCGDDAATLPPFAHETFYETLQQDAEGFALVDGDWKEDYGDAAFYGLAFYTWSAVTTGNTEHQALSEAAYTRTVRVLLEADLITGDVNEIAMSALGMVDYIAATGDSSALGVLDDLLDELNGLVGVFNFYLEGGVIEGYAVDTYGPTSISGLVALLNLQYARLLDTARGEDRLSWAEEAVAAIGEQAWNADAARYDFGDDRPGLFLYPNITMILAHTRLYQLTGLVSHLNRALLIYDTLQALRVKHGPGMVRYKSPYSAETMGATTDDYSTLSSQNYTLFALLLLYEATGEVALMKEWNAIVEFLSTQIYGAWCRSDLRFGSCDPSCAPGDVCLDGVCLPERCNQGVLHHWMDGSVAVASDPEFFCSGCNLQLLYILWYRQHHLAK